MLYHPTSFLAANTIFRSGTNLQRFHHSGRSTFLKQAIQMIILPFSGFGILIHLQKARFNKANIGYFSLTAMAHILHMNLLHIVMIIKSFLSALSQRQPILFSPLMVKFFSHTNSTIKPTTTTSRSGVAPKQIQLTSLNKSQRHVKMHLPKRQSVIYLPNEASSLYVPRLSLINLRQNANQLQSFRYLILIHHHHHQVQQIHHLKPFVRLDEALTRLKILFRKAQILTKALYVGLIGCSVVQFKQPSLPRNLSLIITLIFCRQPKKRILVKRPSLKYLVKSQSSIPSVILLLIKNERQSGLRIELGRSKSL